MLLGVISHRRTTTPTRLGHAIRLNKYSCVLYCWPSLRIKCWIPIYPFFSCSALKIVLLRAIPLQVHYYGRNEMYFCGTRHSRHTVDVWKITLFTIYNLFCFSLGSYSDKYFSLQFLATGLHFTVYLRYKSYFWNKQCNYRRLVSYNILKQSPKNPLS